MRQTELSLKEADSLVLKAFRSKGVHPAREVNRAHVLMALDEGVPEARGEHVTQANKCPLPDRLWQRRVANDRA